MKLQSVAVFGSGTVTPESEIYQTAVQLGSALACAQFVVYHGGYFGVMEAVSRGVRWAEGESVGIVTDQFEKDPNPWVSEIRRVKSWQERLFALIDSADAFVVLDGKTGTLTELMVIWEMSLKGFLQKPTLLLGEQTKEMVNYCKEKFGCDLPKNFQRVDTAQEAAELLDKGGMSPAISDEE